MNVLAEGIGLLLGLAGLLAMLSAAYAWHQVPKETVKQLREELAEQRNRIADRDRELADFRRQRQGDLKRLEADEVHIRRIEDEVTDLRSWRYGAERYMQALEQLLKRHHLPFPSRAHYGINGDWLEEEPGDDH